LVHGLFGAADTAESLRMSTGIKSYLKGLNEKSGDHLYYVGLESTLRTGMFSYPNFNGIYKSLDHPDIYQLGLLAEQAGIDYRILVIQRNSNAILKSVDRRDFGRANEEPKILIDNAAVLHTQLTLLDRRFYHCIDYEDLATIRSDPKQRAALMDFLHPKQMQPVLDQMLKVIKPSKNDPNEPKFILNDSVVMRNAKHDSTQEYLAFQLQARMSLIDNLCRSKSHEV